MAIPKTPEIGVRAMAFELDKREDAATNVRRIVCERVDTALNCLSAAKGRAEGESVHTARKRFKEIRAALRLIRDAVDGDLFRKENRTYRDAARPLSEIRDSRALIEALDALVKHFGDELKSGAFADVRKILTRRARACRQKVVVEQGALREVQRSVRRARKRIERWPLEGLTFPTFIGGIAETYRAGRRLMSIANDLGTDETHHEWRKQVKYLRHQSEILCPLWPEAMRLLVDEAHELADLLGDDHDLAVMKQALTHELHDAIAGHERKALLGLIAERRATLQKRAKRLGRKLFADKRKAFRRRVSEYLAAWA